MTPEARQRVKNIKAFANRLREVAHNNPLLVDFMRNGKGPADVVWVCDRLEELLDSGNTVDPGELSRTDQLQGTLASVREDARLLQGRVDSAEGALDRVRDLLEIGSEVDVVNVLKHKLAGPPQTEVEVCESEADFEDDEDDFDDELDEEEDEEELGDPDDHDESSSR